MLEGVIQANVISSRYVNVKESFLNTRIFASEANRTEQKRQLKTWFRLLRVLLQYASMLMPYETNTMNGKDDIIHTRHVK